MQRGWHPARRAFVQHYDTDASFAGAAAGLMPDRYRIIGSSRPGLTPERIRCFARSCVMQPPGGCNPSSYYWVR
jgi:hypothetical protein